MIVETKCKNRPNGALITGAGGGIGQCLALTFARSGYKVLVNDVSHENLARLTGMLDDESLDYVPFQADISLEKEVVDMMRTFTSKTETIDVLINNAGIMSTGFLNDLDVTVWDRIFSVNLRGTFLCSKACLPLMLQIRSGRIINIASIAGEIPRYALGAYCASKAGVIQLSKVLALEVAKYGVTVNVISPGATETPMLQRHTVDIAKQIKGDLETFRLGIPLGRLTKPKEIASLALFLCSEEASHITGQVISLDGGQSIV